MFNLKLALVVLLSFTLQVTSHHNATLASFLKTSLMPLSDCLILLAISTFPLIVLELVKVIRLRRQSISHLIK